MQFTQIKETCLYCADLDRTKRFYTEILGLELISAVKGRHVFFRAGSSVLLCFNAEVTKKDKHLPPHYGEGHLHFALEIKKERYESCKNTLKERGVAVLHDQVWPNNRKSFYFRDPDGHLAEIVEEGLWEN